MKLKALITLYLAFLSPHSLATSDPNFTGSWEIDIRTSMQVRANTECGNGSLNLRQTDTSISGTYHYASPSCEKLYGVSKITGTLNGITAILEIENSYNGEVVRGRARLVNEQFYWQVLGVRNPASSNARGYIIHSDSLAR